MRYRPEADEMRRSRQRSQMILGMSHQIPSKEILGFWAASRGPREILEAPRRRNQVM